MFEEHLTFDDLKEIGARYGWAFKNREAPFFRNGLSLVIINVEMVWPPVTDVKLEVPCDFNQNHASSLSAMFDLVGKGLCAIGFQGNA